MYGQMRHAEASSDTTIYTNKMLTFPDLTKKVQFFEIIFTHRKTLSALNPRWEINQTIQPLHAHRWLIEVL